MCYQEIGNDNLEHRTIKNERKRQTKSNLAEEENEKADTGDQKRTVFKNEKGSSDRGRL